MTSKKTTTHHNKLSEENNNETGDIFASIYNDDEIKNDLDNILSEASSNKIPNINNKGNIEATALLADMDQNDITKLQNVIRQTDDKNKRNSMIIKLKHKQTEPHMDDSIIRSSTMISSNTLYDKLAQLQCILQKNERYSTKEQQRKQTIARLKKYVHLIQSHKNTFENDVTPTDNRKTKYVSRNELIPNPCVAIYNSSNNFNLKVNETPSISCDSLLGNQHRDISEPKRVKYELPNSNGEVFELYEWLKPIKLLGEGSYATVYSVIDERSDKTYAIKKNKDIFINVSDAIRVLREIKLMTHFNHPNIMRLHGVIMPKYNNRYTFKDCYLIMHKMDTTLANVIRSKQQLSERHIKYFIYQIARGLEYIHSGGIIHRDLKPENILINTTECTVKITDFGLARGVGTDIYSRQKLTEYVVTRWYRAPEVMCCSQLYDYQIDIWSLGCIAAELYTRIPIFKGRNHFEQLQLIFDIMGTPKDLSWITSIDAKKWIVDMTYKSPNNTPKDLNKILPNSTKLAQDFISKLLIVNPNKRPDISSIIKHVWMKEFTKDKHYKTCPIFNISFEYKASIKTVFGVRYMMYEELNKFYKLCHLCVKKQRKQQQYKHKTFENIKIYYNYFA